MKLKDLLPVLIVPLLTWIMSTYAFTEIMRQRMNDASEERGEITHELKLVGTAQTDQEVRLRILDNTVGGLKQKVTVIEEKVFSK